MKTELRNTKKNLVMLKMWSFVVMIFLLLFIVACEHEEEYPQYDPPADHTVNKEGVKHKSGLSDPTVNCVACHGADLTGGTSGVSCFECHGKEW